MFFKVARQLTLTSRCYITSRSVHLSRNLLQDINPGSKTYRPNNLEKKFLVWTGKYKSVEEVPQYISNEEMERTRNKVRIRVANIMMVATIIGCITMVISGKRALERGESVSKMNMDWHKKYNEQNAGKKAEE